jgi:ABC-type amino acid transport substrate-binding protein
MCQHADMRRVVAPVAVALLALSACSGGASEDQITTLESGVLTACMYPGFAPFAEKEGDGTWGGWDVDFIRDFADERGLTLQIKEISAFNDIWMRPGANECDIAGSGITRTDQRVAQTGEAGRWSDTYYTVAHGFAVRQGSALDGIEDLAGQTVVTTKGTTADTDVQARLQQAGITTTTVKYVDSEEAAALLVLDGSAFAFAAGVGSIEALIDQHPGLELAWEHCIMLRDGTVSSEPFGFVVRSDSTGLLAALNQYIADPSVPYQGGLGTGRDCPSGT